tara:strand:+ start:51 stop:704 length:654 start_codon:yes stop_codon:yes gene_type:complete
MKLNLCAICGSEEDLHHHHWEPKSLGGSDDEINILTLCAKHHSEIHGHKKRVYYKKLAKKGIARARAKNPEKYSGRKTGTYTVNSDKILKLRAKRFSISFIASALNVGKSTVVNHIDRNTAKNIGKALTTMGKQNNLVGSFNFKYDFHNGLSATYKVKGFKSKPSIIPRAALKCLMTASKELYVNHYDLDKALYEELMIKKVYDWYTNELNLEGMAI